MAGPGGFTKKLNKLNNDRAQEHNVQWRTERTRLSSKYIFVHRYVTQAAERDAKLGVGEGVKCLPVAI